MTQTSSGDPAPGVLRRVDHWLLSTAPPERLAILRLAIGAYALVTVLVNVGEFARLGSRSARQFEPVGLAGFLDGPVSPVVLWSLFGVLMMSGAAFIAGAWCRLAGPIFALCTLAWATYHASWGQMLHFEHLVTLHLLLLGFSPAAEALSFDARNRTSARLGSSVRFGWPIRLMAIVTATTYVLAAIAKIRASGWAWIDGVTLSNHIAYSATRLDLLGGPRPPLATFVIGQEWLIRPAALLGGWFRRLWVPTVLLFHLGILTTMFVFFSYNGLGFALLPLYRLEAIVEWFQQRRRTNPAGLEESRVVSY